MATTLNKPSRNNLPADVHLQFRRNEQELDNGEIGVFSAEKYFNGVIEVDHSPRISKFSILPNKFNDPKLLIRPPSTTPSVRSQSSWNSQSTLLQNRNSLTKANKSNRKTRMGFLAGLGCNCMCSDSNSIAVEDQHLSEISFKKGPIPRELIHLSSVVENLGKQRKSLEVFGSPLQHNNISKSFRIMETRPSLLSRRMDSAAKTTSLEEDIDMNNINNGDSDESSSDLFEIESITGKVNGPFLARQGSPDAAASGCVTPTTCYAPSEASIEWSVVTASAADFSAMSDYEEIRPPIASNFVKTISAVGETLRPRHPSISLGCSSIKAVGVADRTTNIDYKPPVNLNDQRLRQVSDSYLMPAIRYPADSNKLTEFAVTPRQKAFSNVSIPPNLPPPRTSQLFYNSFN